jgi:hypothetical protein
MVLKPARIDAEYFNERPSCATLGGDILEAGGSRPDGAAGVA